MGLESTAKCDPFDRVKAPLSGWCIERHSGEALPTGRQAEQASALMPGSRRVDNLCSCDIVTTNHRGPLSIVPDSQIIC
jgi:hypothetical protein